MAACNYKEVMHRDDYDAAIEPAMKAIGRAPEDYEGDANYDGDAWIVTAFLLEQKVAEIERLRTALAFAKSVIKSGKGWSKECERILILDPNG